MEYKEFRNSIKDFVSKKDDNSFIQYEIMYNCSFLLEDSHSLIQNGKLSFSYPVMRQIYEYIIIVIAFDFKITNIEDFAKVKTDDSYINSLKRKIWIKAIEESGQNKAMIFKGFMKGLWKSLCERTHANFDRLLLQAYEYDIKLSQNDQLKDEAIIIYRLLSALFWVFADYIVDNKKNKKNYSIFKGKHPVFTKSIKYSVSNNGIVERILSIKHIQTVFSKRFIKIKNEYIDLKPELDKLRNELNEDEEVV